LGNWEIKKLGNWELKIAAIDFETTGTVPGYANQPWQIGVVPVVDGMLHGDKFFTSLINVGPRPFNKHAPGRHAQLRDAIAAAPTMTELFPVLLPMLTGRILLAHNAGTERSALAAAAPLHKFGPWLDTLTLSRAAWQGLDSYTLEDLCECFGLCPQIENLCPGRGPHDAFYDAAACATLFLHILRQPGWSRLTPEELCAI